jgi:hypothetical protein
MTAEKSTPRRFGAAFVALALTGCAQVIGIDDFTVADTGGVGASGGGGTSADPCNEVHGCKRTMATNFTGLPTVHVNFDSTGFDPPCILVDSSATLTFDGQGYTFDDVPVTGGVLPTADPLSPIQNPDPANVLTASFKLGSACSYPYFSPLLNKAGVVFVVSD